MEKNLSPAAASVLEALRSNLEGAASTEGAQRWGDVYLGNARPAGMNPRSFAGYLSALEDAGLYRRMDGDFGTVLLAD